MLNGCTLKALTINGKRIVRVYFLVVMEKMSNWIQEKENDELRLLLFIFHY